MHPITSLASQRCFQALPTGGSHPEAASGSVVQSTEVDLKRSSSMARKLQPAEGSMSSACTAPQHQPHPADVIRHCLK